MDAAYFCVAPGRLSQQLSPYAPGILVETSPPTELSGLVVLGPATCRSSLETFPTTNIAFQSAFANRCAASLLREVVYQLTERFIVN